MESLFELIFQNPFLLFVIIAGIVSFVNRFTSGTSEQEQKTDSKQDEASGGQTMRDMMRRMQEMAESLDPDAQTKESQSEASQHRAEKKSKQPLGRFETPSETTEEKYSYEEQREAQYNQLRKRYERPEEPKDLETTVDVDSPIYSAATQTERKEISDANITVNLKSRLNKKGLVESIVMAEILGPPRARKRYNSRYDDR